MAEDAAFPIIETFTAAPPVLAGRFQLEEKAILLGPDDNVAVARTDLARGITILFRGAEIVLRDSIPAGHKFALREIPLGAWIHKYSQIIGKALYPIQTGEWVHTHNVELAHDLDHHEFAVVSPQPPELPDDLPLTFNGYRRADGRVGTRNYIAVVATSNCSSFVCERIADEFKGFRDEHIDGVVALPHQEGCGHHDGPDLAQLERTLKGMILNPNVAGVVVVGLGCEMNQLTRYSGEGPDLRKLKPLVGMEIQTSGGTLKTTAHGAAKVRELIETVSRFERTEESVAHILVGLNCGGSDAFSGITANPALGYASDLLIAAGGAVVLAETPEIFGAEQVLTRRAVDVETGKRLVAVIRRFQEYAGRFGATLDSNPAPGNKRGGITNIVEKSLGAVMKGGTTMLTSVVDYAEQVTAKGLVVMDTPGYDPVSITGIAAGGCNVICFTTGRGSAIGFPTVPVVKLATNSRIFSVMNDNMDINAGEILDGRATVQSKGIEIYRHIVRVASGERTKAEQLGHKEFAPWRIGPVM
jgi:altronate hydrolase